ncbi:DUF6691 family protein [Blastomonas fulva]|uniref:DUF6691 family protein n=1 Tax=Blastomonas fulva TaxID=1550728 RepID=UPI0025A372D8|nr:DUF6691 family protein [Blastomonas fulva]MDM7927229.1 YeeE/YedE family protein [Blastomonas fulva]MDM7966346.1 YeeE/YedE family protein [Blastomonas fulva]
MKQTAIALAAGLIFGAGLAVSGMADPQRVQAFLDLFGAWDPTLAFVMGGSMIPMAIAWVVQRRMAAPVAASRFDLPGTNRIDPRLAIGGLIFGAGWGIGGLCPGPAIADLAIAPAPAAMFIAAMLAGMAVHRFAIR